MSERPPRRPTRRSAALATVGLLATLACAPSFPPAGGRPGPEQPTSGGGLRGLLRATRSDAADRREAWALEILELANVERRRAGVPALALDPDALRFAESEASRLLREGVFGHRSADGSLTHQRWVRLGGVGVVRENLFRLTGGARRAHAVFEPARAHGRLMSSRGHRRAILDPAWTGAGVAVAWAPSRNSVYVVQEFVARHAELDVGDRPWRPGESRVLTGRLLTAAKAPWMAVLRRDATGELRDDAPAVVLSPVDFALDPGGATFRAPLRLPRAARPGSYTLHVYVRDPRLPPPAGRRRSTRDGVAGGMAVLEVVGG